MYKRRKLTIFLAIVAVFCFSISALAFNFSGLAAEQQSILLQKQANYALTGNYEVKDLKGFNNSFLENNGLLLYSSDESAHYKLADGCISNFSFVALPVATSFQSVDLSDINAVKSVTADFSQLTLSFNDDSDNVLTVKLLGEKGVDKIANEQIKYTISFNGKEAGISGVINQSFRTICNGKVKPIYFYFNSENKFIVFDVSGENSQQKIDLSNISGLNFTNYSVDMKLEGLTTSESQAKLVLLELCGQALNGDKVKPIINQRIISNGIVGAKYKLPQVYAYDILDCKNISDKIIFSINKDSASIQINNRDFKPNQPGEYQITASLLEGNTLINSVSSRITVFAYKPQVEFALSEDILESCKAYDTVKIPHANVSSDLFLEDVAVDVNIVLNGKSIYRVENLKNSFEYKFNVYGQVSIIYSVLDYFGYVTNYEKVIDVKNAPNLQNVSLPSQFSLNGYYNIESPTMIYDNKYYNVYTEILTPSGEVLKNVQGYIKIDEIGSYTITFYSLVDGVQYTNEYIVESVLSPESIVKEVNDIALVQANCDLPEYSLAGNGLKILGTTTGATFTFNNVIDFTEFTREDTVISLQVLNANNLSTFNKVIVTLTDVNDLSNKVSVRLLRNNTGVGADQWSYVTAKYKDGYAGVSNNGSSAGKVQRTDWGGTVNWCSFNGLKYSNCAQFAFSIDYDSRCIYTATGRTGTEQSLVLDLDDINHVGVGNEWNGFSNGKAYLTITMEGLTSTGGIIVTNVANNSLSGDELVDNIVPKIYLSTDNSFSTLPLGELGTKYSLPKILAWDMIDQELDTQVMLYKNNKTNLIEFDEESLTFVPTETGTYFIEYKAEDDAGNVVRRNVSFEIVGKIEDFSAKFITLPKIAKIGDLYTIPKIKINGGSSIVSISEKVFYNGIEIEISKNRSVRLNQPGKIEVVVEVVDYLGNVFNSSLDNAGGLIINILSADLPLIEVKNVPTIVYNGENLILPEYEVFNGQKEQAGIIKKVEVNGQEITDTMKYKVSEPAGTILTVNYYAIGQEVSVKTFEVLVVDPMYISDYIAVKNLNGTYTNSMQGVQVNMMKEYLEYVFSAGKQVLFPQNLVANSLIIKLGVNPLYSDFQYFDIYLSDSYDQDNVVFLRVCRDGYLEVNGDSSDRIKINASFTSDDSYFYFIYDDLSRELLSEDGTLITRIDRNVLGFKFKGFKEGLTNLSVVIPDCANNSNSSIRIMQIANQTFMSAFSGGVLSKYNDKTGPLIRFDNNMENNTILKGETINISSASAHDVFRTKSTISVTLSYSETGEKIYEGNCLQSYSYIPMKCGTYEIKYVAKDDKKRESTKIFYIIVKETDAPILETDIKIKSQYKINDIIRYIQPSIEDENTVEYYMIIVQPDGKRVVVKEKESYKFTVVGEYKIILYAEDVYFNVSKLEYDISVKG